MTTLQIVVEMLFVIAATLALCYIGTYLVRWWQNREEAIDCWGDTVLERTVKLPRVESSLGPYWWEKLENQEEISDLEIKLLVALTIPDMVEEELGEWDEFDVELNYNHFSEEEMVAALNANTRRF
jgi:hypothetical protein